VVLDPRTRYVDIDGYSLAYQVLAGGDGGHSVWYQDLTQHLDLYWTDPSIAAGFAELSRDVTCVLLQRRGVGLSAPVDHVPAVETQAADLLAVMDAVGVRRATLCGTFSTSAAVCMVAAQHPDRVAGVVLVQPFAQGPLAEDLDERVWPAERAVEVAEFYRVLGETWGHSDLQWWDPGLDAAYNRRVIGMAQRSSVAPVAARAWIHAILRGEHRAIMDQVRVPTRVVHFTNNRMPRSVSADVAGRIPGAQLRVSPPSILGDSIGHAWAPAFELVRELTFGGASRPATDRVLASLLFTDIVGSTDHLARLGDGRWREVLREHELMARREVAAEGGRIVAMTGDGTFSTFPGPAAAVRCGRAMSAATQALGVEIRAGVHAGECEQLGDDLVGIAVHIGARVSGLARASEVLVSRAVRDLVAGSGLQFRAHGTHQLKGVPDTWELFALSERDTAPKSVARTPETTVLDRAAVSVARTAPALLRAANRAGNAWQRRRHRQPARQAHS
jgi:class 3 adenylate cyclase